MKKQLVAFGVGGVAGYTIENVLWGPRASPVMQGLPFMPVWGAGAAAVSVVAPKLKRAGVGWYGRLTAYALAGAAIEYVGFNAEKVAGLPQLWGYGPNGDQPVDLEHALSWGLLGLAVDAMFK